MSYCQCSNPCPSNYVVVAHIELRKCCALGARGLLNRSFVKESLLYQPSFGAITDKVLVLPVVSDCFAWRRGGVCFPKGPRTPKNGVLGPKYYTINGIWALKPDYLGRAWNQGYYWEATPCSVPVGVDDWGPASAGGRY